ncbi:RebB family R body protein [Candidatus Finniella inopinata]|uniref:Uncharacterized protein n=1 Tax=Candidatus Finniella inopinata TaxID=1696036 RepID=A0A4Q7DK03_9PROT|nr:RebB family R body protein [Candidatus Finniella inopinata]RZI46619.1 hypothetical protein EQU50_03260 [Candidatus Finniella inopinata]
MADSFDPSVSFIHGLVTGASTLQSESVGKACQAMAHTLALALQDASDSQRNFDAINGAALAKATEEFVKSKDPAWLPVIEGLQKAKMTQDTEFLKISQGVEGLLKNLPLPS